MSVLASLQNAVGGIPQICARLPAPITGAISPFVRSVGVALGVTPSTLAPHRRPYTAPQIRSYDFADADYWMGRARVAVQHRGCDYRFFKWTSDKVMSASALMLLGPLMAPIGIAVALTSDGPIIYRQVRRGKDGRNITVFKFRTLVDGADREGTRTVEDNDPRLTAVGKTLRRYRLDELPQFFNVLIGDMSIIGPRPEAIDAAERKELMIPAYRARYSVKPGITGRAQIRMMSDNADYFFSGIQLLLDVEGIEEASAISDLKVILNTVGTMLSGRGM